MSATPSPKEFFEMVLANICKEPEKIDMQMEETATLCSMPTLRRGDQLDYQPHRLDGHPVWSRDYRQVCFQAAPDGKRQLYIADVDKLT